jgi:tetratricopeptide (TPR) repeat protein
MKTIAFYSYKGGVGRTLAVAHVAYWLSKQGKTVFMLDMDMEAPGLHYKLEQYNHKITPTKGLVDFIGYFQREEKAARSLEEYTIPLKSTENGMSPMWLMPAGDPFAATYWKQLSQVEWKEFLYKGEKWGSLLFLELKAMIEKEYAPDFLLIDSRTGLTDLTGIGMNLLADDAVILAVNNTENIDGSRIVMERLRRAEKLPFKEEKTRMHFVLTRLPAPQNLEDFNREQKITKEVLKRLNMGSGIASGELVSKVKIIHSDPEQQVSEKLRFRETNWERYPILKDYMDLVFEISGVRNPIQDVKSFDLFWDCLNESNSEKRYFISKKFVDQQPNNVHEYFQRGIIEGRNLGEYDLAIDSFSKAIELDNSYERAYFNRGIAYFRQRELQLALADYTRAIEINPRHSSFYDTRADVLRFLQQFQQAHNDIQRSLKINPSNSDAYKTQAEIYSDEGNTDLFYESLQKALDLDPTQINNLDPKTLARHQQEPRFQLLLQKYAPK